MSPTSAHPTPRLRSHARRRARLIRALVGLAVAVLAWGVLRPTEARLRPYYVVQGGNFGAIQPRILFVLDTSGSMSDRAEAGATPCRWDECETTVGQPTASRMATARAAIRSVVAGLGDNATFGLMTFSQAAARLPPAVPPLCTPSGPDSARRFTWVEYYNRSGWRPIERDAGVQGAWRLCQGSQMRPYAYLRWDELGVGSVISGNNEAGAVPPSPLISVASGDIDHVDNSQRRVQWFSRFMGVRAHLDDTTDPDGSITHATVGDYGADDATRDVEVRGHDFYYWPYVDGFPGYYQWNVWPYADGGSNADRAGVANDEGGLNVGQLYAPFYIDLSASGLPTDVWGPASRETGNASVLALTSPITEGGVDAAGGTPWRSAIGTVVATPPETNAPYAHTTVASYLSFVAGADGPDACSPVSAVLLTDGEPSNNEGGGELYARIAALRTALGVDVYVVGFVLNSQVLNDMACAGAGACDGGGTCDTPCDDVPADEWDTCNDPDNHGTACAYVATNSAELVEALTDIAGAAVDVELPTGQGSTVNSFGVGADGSPGEGAIVQTNFAAYTEFPGWRGHVVRSLCTETDLGGDPLPHCTLPNPEFETEELEETFGPCPQSHTWDAGECLQSTPWTERRLFTNAAGDHTLIPIAEADGTASGAFRAELDARGLLTSADHEAEANAIAAFVLGQNAPGGWKLPGLASSAPAVVRRVPRFRTDRVPEVAINDPHCAGRLYGEVDAGALPNSLEDFARDANDEDNLLGSPSPHHEYQEAVLVGDDMGVLHAFQLDSGNELWGFIPNEQLTNLVAQAANGPTNMGQPDAVADHIYGVSATVNHGWALDEVASRWLHLGVFGFGAGGQEYYALDLSHMSPESPSGPFEILWSTEDPALAAQYDAVLGQTWARPALTYHVAGDELSATPEALLVLGSGYQASTTPDPGEGRTLVVADAVTGALRETAELPPLAGPVFESSFGAVVDPAVGSHCLSRFWAEAQETYIADPAGRLFRWDLGAETAHAADSGAEWSGVAQPVARMPACEGTGTACTVNPANRGDVFVFPPAVSASNRIDDASAVANNTAAIDPDEFLVALVSGSPADDTIDGRDPANAFHSSLYLLVDNHRVGDAHAGFTIPAGAPKFGGGTSVAGSTFTDNAGYLRLALSDIERTRTVVPFSGADPIVETRAFSKLARPVRPPRIFVTGVADNASGEPVVIEGVEVYLITFTVFEPASGACDLAFFDTATDTWHVDGGSSYEITFRLVTDGASGFDFIAGATPAGVDFGGGFTPGLTLTAVDQIVPAGCEGGDCGIVTNNGSSVPCDNNAPPASAGITGFAVPATTSQIPGFTPVE